MTQQMNTDTAGLAKSASQFEDISGRIKAELSKITGHVHESVSHWSGPAQQAFTSTMTRWDEAASKMNTTLETIHTNISTSGTHYSSQEDAQTSALGAGLNL